MGRAEAKSARPEARKREKRMLRSRELKWRAARMYQFEKKNLHLKYLIISDDRYKAWYTPTYILKGAYYFQITWHLT